jgi:endonuclease G
MSHMRRRPTRSDGSFPNPGRLPFQGLLNQTARRYPAATLLVIALVVIGVLLYAYIQQRRQIARQEGESRSTDGAGPSPAEPRGRSRGRGVPVSPINVEPGGGTLSMPVVLRSSHFVYGMPRPTDGRFNIRLPTDPPGSPPRPGLSVLVREGFVVGHYDRFKVPAWVMMRWTRDDYERSEKEPGRADRNWAPDEELPEYARAGTDYDAEISHMDRGHMARHEDNKAWGLDNVDMGCRMSNLVPQHRELNGGAWLSLENAHRQVVADPEKTGVAAVWVISGPVFQGDQPDGTVGNGVGVPHATYKVMGWFNESGRFQMRGYVLKQTDRADPPARVASGRRPSTRDSRGNGSSRNEPSVDLRKFLTPVREIEKSTGLDFFSDLPDPEEEALETIRPSEPWNSR